MRMTEEGLALIKRFEGYRGKAYRDATGIWTIGYGHTSMAGAPAVAGGLEITREQASEILARDVGIFARDVKECLALQLRRSAGQQRHRRLEQQRHGKGPDGPARRRSERFHDQNCARCPGTPPTAGAPCDRGAARCHEGKHEPDR